jgi:hypothetical protein
MKYSIGHIQHIKIMRHYPMLNLKIIRKTMILVSYSLQNIPGKAALSLFLAEKNS